MTKKLVLLGLLLGCSLAFAQDKKAARRPLGGTMEAGYKQIKIPQSRPQGRDIDRGRRKQ